MRKTLIKIHLVLAAISAPAILIIALSGGLYLMDIKGTVKSATVVEVAAKTTIDKADLKASIDKVLVENGIEHSYDYVRASGSRFITRPTSRSYYMVDVADEQLKITLHEPDLVRSIIELHKGHGPTGFRVFQQIIAVSLMLVLITGLILGLQSPKLRNITLVLSVSGVVGFLLLALI